MMAKGPTVTFSPMLAFGETSARGSMVVMGVSR
jgi:hypothetical protein